jgi:repressor LexA
MVQEAIMSEREKSLSERQRAILDYIWEYITEFSRPPTIREIGHAAKISSTSVVNYNLTKLKEMGLLSRDAEVSRGLRLTDKAMELYEAAANTVRNLVRIPLAGDIVASQPVEMGHENFAVYDDSDAIELSTSMFPKNTKDVFALRVRGDSMIDAMVNDGDIVIMRRQETAQNGDMVAVWLTPSDTTTLKYFYHEGGQVRLQPANPHMRPIYVQPEDVRVQGRVMMVIRQTA